MKVTVLWLVKLKGLAKGLEDREIRGQVKTIETTALLRSAKTLRRVLTGTTTLCQCRPESSDNEGVLHTLPSSRTGASPLDAG